MNEKTFVIDNKIDVGGPPKTRYLIISPCGLGLFLVPRLAQDPNVDKIYFWSPDPHMQEGKELDQLPGWEKLTLLKDPFHALNHLEDHKPSDDLIIIFDDNGLGEMAWYLKNKGYKVIGGGIFDDKMEADRIYAMEFMKKFMKVPEYYAFESFRDGIGFLKAQPKEARYVFKPNDSEVPKEMTYVSKDVPDLISAMEQFKDDWHWKESFILQIFTEGIEADFNCYFNGKEWMEDSLMIYFENKPLGNGDKGPATGGAIAVQLSRPLKGKFFEILDKIKPYLVKVKFRGCFAINSIVSEKDHEPYFLELTPRFGYPSLPLDVSLIEDNNKSMSSFFKALVSDKTTSFFPTDKIAVTASIFKMPFPDVGEGAKKSKGIPISWDKKFDKYFFPYYVQGHKGRMELSGDSGFVGQVTCVDKVLDGAVQMMYDTYLPTLKLTDAYYRTDAGVDTRKRMLKLKEWKLI